MYQKSKCSDDAAVQVKLEATKRKLQNSYQQVANGLSTLNVLFDSKLLKCPVVSTFLENHLPHYSSALMPLPSSVMFSYD